MKTLLLLITAATVLQTGVQADSPEKVADNIVTKAKLIYDLESSAWTANDTLLAKSDFDKRAVNGYVCYKLNDKTVCIFYNKADSVIAEYDYSDKSRADILYFLRPCTTDELKLIKIKRSIAEKIAKGKIENFKMEPNTKYNFVPIISGRESICYLINAVSDTTKLILGRDYEITLDSNYNIIETSCNHKSIQEIQFKVANAKTHYHTHIITDYFWETEIATLMLYKKYLLIDKFIVISSKGTSTWSNSTMTLQISK